jgi:hypothetical protein
MALIATLPVRIDRAVWRPTGLCGLPSAKRLMVRAHPAPEASPTQIRCQAIKRAGGGGAPSAIDQDCQVRVFGPSKSRPPKASMCVSSLTQPSVERIVDAMAWGRGLNAVAVTGQASDAQDKEVCRLGKYAVLALAVAWVVGAGLP